MPIKIKPQTQTVRASFNDRARFIIEAIGFMLKSVGNDNTPEARDVLASAGKAIVIILGTVVHDQFQDENTVVSFAYEAKRKEELFQFLTCSIVPLENGAIRVLTNVVSDVISLMSCFEITSWQTGKIVDIDNRYYPNGFNIVIKPPLLDNKWDDENPPFFKANTLPETVLDKLTLVFNNGLDVLMQNETTSFLYYDGMYKDVAFVIQSCSNDTGWWTLALTTSGLISVNWLPNDEEPESWFQYEHLTNKSKEEFKPIPTIVVGSYPDGLDVRYSTSTVK